MTLPLSLSLHHPGSLHNSHSTGDKIRLSAQLDQKPCYGAGGREGRGGVGEGREGRDEGKEEGEERKQPGWVKRMRHKGCNWGRMKAPRKG